MRMEHNGARAIDIMDEPRWRVGDTIKFSTGLLKNNTDFLSIKTPRRNFMSCAAPPPNFLWLSQIPTENGNFISQPNIFRRISALTEIESIISFRSPNNVESANTVH